jgi:hypothetical protein
MIDYMIGIGIAAIVLFIIVRGIKKSKSGENSCSSCGSCPSAQSCNKK